MIGRGKSRHVKPDSSVATRGMKTYSAESRIELRNLQILKKVLEISNQFLSSEQTYEPKSLDVARKIAGVEKIPSENLRVRLTKSHLIRVLNEKRVNDSGLGFLSSVVGDSQISLI